jgi:hypothetical protein
LQREIVDLDDYAVNLVIEQVARSLPAPAISDNSVDAGGRLDVVVDGKSGSAQICKRFALRF